MSDSPRKRTGKKPKKVKHGKTRFSCEMPIATKAMLREMSDDLDRSESWVAVQAINKFSEIHKHTLAKKEVE
jgi:predicted transcriptional regulator